MQHNTPFSLTTTWRIEVVVQLLVDIGVLAATTMKPHAVATSDYRFPVTDSAGTGAPKEGDCHVDLMNGPGPGCKKSCFVRFSLRSLSNG